jgi:5-methylcytosine-specific restriction endonuclease McrA
MTTVAQVQVFLRQEQVQGVERTPDDTLELFNQFQNKTSKEVKKEIAALKGERVKTILSLELDEEAEALWQQAKAKLAHQTRGDQLVCFKLVLKGMLQERTPQPRRDVSGLTEVRPNKPSAPELRRANARSPQPVQHRSRYIPVAVKRVVSNRDGKKCTNCGSKHAIQFEHIIPYASGGTHHPDNLKLLCRNCNLQQGIERFGLRAMKRDGDCYRIKRQMP